MKKMLLLFNLFFFTSFIFSDSKLDKIAVVDFELVIKTIYPGKFKAIDAEKQEMNDTLAKIKDNILKQEEAKSKEKDEVIKAGIDKKIVELKKQYAEFYRQKNPQIEQKLKNIQEPIFKEVYSMVRKIAESESYSIVLDSKTKDLMYYSPDNDITKKVIDRFKAEPPKN